MTGTFGGKEKLASLDDTGIGAKTSWTNGYEALGVLDADKDGVIKLAELEPIGLWFDENRDGISQAGEVISAKEANLRELYYKNPIGTEHSKDVSIELGFVREVDGKEVSGKSVDWYGEEFNSTAEAINYLEAKSTLGKSSFDISEDKKDSLKVSELEELGESTLGKEGRFNGYWIWELDEELIVGRDENTVAPKGLISLKEHENGKIFGTSFAEVPVKTKGDVARSIVKLSAVIGKIVPASDGKKSYLELTVVDKDGKETLTTASLSSDGNILSGESFVSLSKNKTKKDLSSFKYSWTAKRPEK